MNDSKPPTTCCEREYEHKHLSDGGVDITQSPVAQGLKDILDNLPEDTHTPPKGDWDGRCESCNGPILPHHKTNHWQGYKLHTACHAHAKQTERLFAKLLLRERQRILEGLPQQVPHIGWPTQAHRDYLMGYNNALAEVKKVINEL